MTFTMKAEEYFAHYGTPRKSGRYKWGSGRADEKTYEGNFLEITNKMKKMGLKDTDIAAGFGMTTTQLRAARSIIVNEQKQEKRHQAETLRSAGNSTTAIAKQMGINESSVRSLLAPGEAAKKQNIHTIAGMLKENLDTKGGYLQIGTGVENFLGITATKLNNAVAVLEQEGYKKITVQEDQLGTKNKTLVKVLAPPNTTYRDVVANKSKIRNVEEYSEDGGNSFKKFKPPLNIDPKRVKVRYAEEGGTDADGVIYVRRGVDDVSIGGKNYAQVRIAVGGTHYLKGMAVYKDDLPKGVDLEFNTNKSNTGNKLDAMKKMQRKPDGSIDEDNPFGSQIRRQILGDNDKPKSAMNIVNEEGAWGDWNNSISTQVLSKQSPALAKQQLDMTYEKKRRDLDEIKALTNPAVRRKLLEAYADGADSSAVHLQAAALPRQATHVILPVKSLKPTEIYAPKYRDGETVVLVRYPHGGKFEIPELTVNNRNREGKSVMGKNPLDAVGIHPKVAERLSGADFDGDTVVVFPNSPNNPRRIQSEPALQALKGFDPRGRYGPYDGMKTIDGGVYNAKEKKVDFPPGKSPNARAKGTQMGMVSNLITDMTIMGAPNDELARAVKHSMVVIDAEKHSLNHKQSYQDHAIGALYKKYQGRSGGGAATLISRATAKDKIDEQAPRSAKDGGPIDKQTGKLVTVTKTFVDNNGVTRARKVEVDKLANTDDAYTLMSKPGTKIEAVYAEHSNKLKAMANEARKEVANYVPPKVNPSAKNAYQQERADLIAKLNVARANKPRERQAQIFANAVVAKQVEANPNMDPSQLKKIKSRALEEARARTNALKTKIVPTPQEWAAIQAGAISQNQLKQILDNADLDAIRSLATPRTRPTLTGTQSTRARAMAKQGYTQAEIADQLGVSTTSLKDIISE